jgi:nicotinate-nucleotide--dimethylbenzimidazole phosphoribosyltransferase
MSDAPTPDTTERNPHEDLRELIEAVPPLDMSFAEAVRERIAAFPGPDHPLGNLAERLAWLASTQKRAQPQIARPLVAIFAGSHDVAGPNAIKIAQQRVIGLTQGAAAVRGMAGELGAAFKVYEFGIEHPAADIRKGPSLSARDTAAAFAFGMEVVAEGADIIAMGSVGTGAVTAAAAIAQGLYGGSADYWAKGVGKVGATRVEAVMEATDVNRAELSDPLSILSAFGGRDIAGMAGAMIAARYQAIPVVLDGFVSCAAAAVLHSVNSDSVAHCMAGVGTEEFAQAGLLDRIGLEPLHESGLNIGDGTGATLALGTLKSACAGLSTL